MRQITTTLVAVRYILMTCLNSELVRVHFRKLLKRESPTMQSGSEPNIADGGINLDWAHRSVIVSIGSNDHVDVLNNTLKCLEQFLLAKLELKQCSVHFIHKQHRLDTLRDRLTQHSFSLHANT